MKYDNKIALFWRCCQTNANSFLLAQADDLGAGLEVAKQGALGHRGRLRDGPVDLTQSSSDSATLLASRARRGGGSIDYEDLAEVIPLGTRDTLIDALHRHGYLVESVGDGLALARDLQQTTLADLARDLGLTLGTGPNVSEMPETLRKLLARLGEAEDEILGRSLSDLTMDRVEDVGRPDAAGQLSPSAP